MKIKSQAQAALFGSVASGKSTNKPQGLSSKEAKKKLKGVAVNKLPEYAKKKKR